MIKAVAGSSPQSTLINRTFARPLAVVVLSPYGDPVVGGLILFRRRSWGPRRT